VEVRDDGEGKKVTGDIPDGLHRIFGRDRFGAVLRVPAVYLAWANSLFLSVLAFSKISKLRGISEGQNSDSLRLHHSCV
jgi:hypothetical protein